MSVAVGLRATPSSAAGALSEFATIGDLAEREGMAAFYMTRVARLKLLAPEIIEAILEGKRAEGAPLAQMPGLFSLTWYDQLAAEA